MVLPKKECEVLSNWRLDDDVEIPTQVSNSIKEYVNQLTNSFSEQNDLMQYAGKQYKAEQKLLSLDPSSVIIYENKSISDGTGFKVEGLADSEKAVYNFRSEEHV